MRLQPRQHRRRAVGEIVEHDRRVAGAGEADADVAAVRAEAVARARAFLASERALARADLEAGGRGKALGEHAARFDGGLEGIFQGTGDGRGRTRQRQRD